MAMSKSGWAAFASRKTVVLSTFGAVHLLFLAFLTPRIASGTTYGDVGLYREWAYEGIETGLWQGIDVPWVYPIAAMLPMVAATVFGSQLYMLAWFLLCCVLNLAAVLSLLYFRAARYGWQSAYLWMGLTLALGPLAFSRVDGITAPLVVVGLLLAMAHPVLASALLSIATWIKVWPAAVVLALVITSKNRIKVILAGAALSGAIVMAVVVKGGGHHLFGFMQAQGDRGMQLEAPLTTPGVWQAVLGTGTNVHPNFAIVTMEIKGSLADTVAALMNPLLVVSLVLVASLMIFAVRRGARRTEILLIGALALVAAMIIFNKVGSPQFMIWLVAVISVGVAIEGSKWLLPAVMMVLISILTTLVYPILYVQLFAALNPGVALLLTTRNVLVVALLVWALKQLTKLARNGANMHATEPVENRIGHFVASSN